MARGEILEMAGQVFISGGERQTYLSNTGSGCSMNLGALASTRRVGHRGEITLSKEIFSFSLI